MSFTQGRRVKHDLSFVSPGLILTSSELLDTGIPATSSPPYLSGCSRSMSWEGGF